MSPEEVRGRFHLTERLQVLGPAMTFTPGNLAAETMPGHDEPVAMPAYSRLITRGHTLRHVVDWSGSRFLTEYPATFDPWDR